MSLYKFLVEKRADGEGLRRVMEGVAGQLIARSRGVDPFTKDAADTPEARRRLVEAPVALVGRVQAGKTRAYLGVMARCLDEGFDVAVILTRNSDVLGCQTLERVKRDFSKCDDPRTPIGARRLRVVSAREVISIKQLMRRRAKLVIVAQKNTAQIENLRERIIYGGARDLRYLFIDDEADYNSISYEGDAPSKVMRYIFDIRKRFNGRGRGRGILAMLQVTATPGALYLQPDRSDLARRYITLQPDYTALLESHESYVGGDEFLSSGQLCRELDSELVSRLNGARGGWFEPLRELLCGFFVAGAIRALEEERADEPFSPPYSCACLIHLSGEQLHHRAQAERALEVIDWLINAAEDDPSSLSASLELPLRDLARSRSESGFGTPSLDEVTAHLRSRLDPDEADVEVAIINSDPLSGEGGHPAWDYARHPLFRGRELTQQLSESPRLALNASFNIFIGGDAFTRGVTIERLLTTLYAREATVDVDTLLQHARWCGARPPADLSVTRLYMTPRAADKQRSAHAFDQLLRRQITSTGGRLEVLAVGSDDLDSAAGVQRVTSLDRKPPSYDEMRGSGNYYPIGFSLAPPERLAELTAAIDARVRQGSGVDDITGRAEWSAGRDECYELLELIDACLRLARGAPGVWNHEVAKMMLTVGTSYWERSARVRLFGDGVATPRHVGPLQLRSRAPSLRHARQEVNRGGAPLLMLIRCEGGPELGWGQGGPFYWPYQLNPPRTRAFTFFHTDQEDTDET